MPVDEEAPAEDVPLLYREPQTSQSSEPSNKVVCRICLEEDDADSLEQPCACSGTVSHAHHDCLQKWVMAKGNKTCEICKQEYNGEFEVPPAPQQDVADALRLLGPVRTIVINADGVIQTLPALPEDEDDEVTDEERRKAGVAWCLTFLMFTSLMLLLHRSMGGPDDGPAGPPPDPSSQDPEAVGFPLFVFWVLTRALLIGLPLYMVMRAAREARRAALHAHFRMLHDSGANWGLVFPSTNGHAELIQIQREISQRDSSEPPRARGPDNV